MNKCICGHDKGEHNFENRNEYEKKFGILHRCEHDNYVDDGGERIHDICKCTGFTKHSNGQTRRES